MTSPFGNVRIPRSRGGRSPRQPHFEEATLRDFTGGLNIVDNDLILKTKYAKELDNAHRGLDGTMSIRPGTKMIKEMQDDAGISSSDTIIETVYFQDKLVCFHSTGIVSTYNYSDGTTAVIWNSTIAGALPGSPSGWSTGLTSIDTTEFRNELVVCNGVDKPLLISETHTVTYLQDTSSGSNINTPIGKYVTTVGNYVCIGNITTGAGEVYISSSGTSGVWPGDSAPNDSTSLVVDSYAAITGGDIIAISSFRSFLLVHFLKATIVFTLGGYNSSGNHSPEYIDTISDYGALSHRSIVSLRNEVVFNDLNGVSSARRNLFSAALIEADSISDSISKDYVTSVSSDAAHRLKSFAVYNDLERRIYIFVYDGTSYSIWEMTFEEGLKKVAWATASNWSWDCAASSSLGRVFFIKGTRIYLLGNQAFSGEGFGGDFINDYDSVWATTTAYVVGHVVKSSSNYYRCTTAHTSGSTTIDDDISNWEVDSGEDITFTWELPWTDTNTRMRKKLLGYIGLDTKGVGAFTLSTFVDNIYKDSAGNLDPALSLEFVGGDSGGYGNQDQPYGGGRRAVDERSWGFPVEFKIIKLRLTGTTKGPLSFAAISVLFRRGTFRR